MENSKHSKVTKYPLKQDTCIEYSWEKMKTSGPTPSPRAYHSANPLGQRIFIFGGCDSKGTPMDDIYVFNASNFSWEYPTTTGTSPKRGHHAAAFVGTTLYIIGGWDGSRRKVFHYSIVFLLILKL